MKRKFLIVFGLCMAFMLQPYVGEATSMDKTAYEQSLQSDSFDAAGEYTLEAAPMLATNYSQAPGGTPAQDTLTDGPTLDEIYADGVEHWEGRPPPDSPLQDWVAWIVAAIGILIGAYQYFKRKAKDKSV